MDEDELIAVSPRHSVRLAPEYVAFVRRAPRRDFLVRTIVKREANGMPLMTADIVIAGEATRAKFPAAAKYPLHFRKIYYPGRLHGDPAVEFACQELASKLVGIPPPIGHGPDVFRSCLLPGVPYQRLSPFGNEPEEANIPRAEKLDLATAAGLYRFAEEAFEQLSRLHEGGLGHGDAELHNFIVCASPLEVITIDFEGAMKKEGAPEEPWERILVTDFEPLLREAVFHQCRLGRQPGRFAELALERIEALFNRPDAFRKAIDLRTQPPA